MTLYTGRYPKNRVSNYNIINYLITTYPITSIANIN